MLLARVGLPLVSQQLPASAPPPELVVMVPSPAFVGVLALWIPRLRWLLGRRRRWQLMPVLSPALVSPPCP